MIEVVRFHTRFAAGGKEIRTVGPAVKEKPFRHAIWLLFARTYRTSGLADETGTSRIKKFTLLGYPTDKLTQAV